MNEVLLSVLKGPSGNISNFVYIIGILILVIIISIIFFLMLKFCSNMSIAIKSKLGEIFLSNKVDVTREEEKKINDISENIENDEDFCTLIDKMKPLLANDIKVNLIRQTIIQYNSGYSFDQKVDFIHDRVKNFITMFIRKNYIGTIIEFDDIFLTLKEKRHDDVLRLLKIMNNKLEEILGSYENILKHNEQKLADFRKEVQEELIKYCKKIDGKITSIDLDNCIGDELKEKIRSILGYNNEDMMILISNIIIKRDLYVRFEVVDREKILEKKIEKIVDKISRSLIIMFLSIEKEIKGD